MALSPDSYTGALARALALGNDVDTVMGMTGAISGAHMGIHAVLTELLVRLEEGDKGRTVITQAANRLYARFEIGSPSS